MANRKRACLMLLCLSCLCLGGCHEEADRSEAPRKAMQQALNLLVAERYEDYFACMDFGEDLDSAQQALFATTLMRQVALTHETRSGLQGALVLDARMTGDTIATVFYRQYFANGDSTDCAQKMTRNAEGRWLLRMRN